jgi:hypothetical protein
LLSAPKGNYTPNTLESGIKSERAYPTHNIRHVALSLNRNNNVKERWKMTDAKPVPTPRKESEASQILKFGHVENTCPVVTFEVQPRKQLRVSLGDFTADKPPLGFTLEVSPESISDSIVAQLTKLSAEYDEYELILHVANYEDRTVSVEVFAA